MIKHNQSKVNQHDSIIEGPLYPDVRSTPLLHLSMIRHNQSKINQQDSIIEGPFYPDARKYKIACLSLTVAQQPRMAVCALVRRLGTASAAMSFVDLVELPVHAAQQLVVLRYQACMLIVVF